MPYVCSDYVICDARVSLNDTLQVTSVIISASRRTDIPAFYSEWLLNRVRAGYCAVPNPFNRDQVSRVSLLPEDVDAIVFWTRHARPLMEHLAELDSRGFHYYFQYTIMHNPKVIDAASPSMQMAIRTFKDLSLQLGDTRRVIWRYDPIVISDQSPWEFHLNTFGNIAREIEGYTTRSVVSLVDPYAKARGRFRKMEQAGIRLDTAPESRPWFAKLMQGLADIARDHGMEIESCAEALDLDGFGIGHGKCVDNALLANLFGLDVGNRKDKGQREACGCVTSRDIGMYDTCVFGCQYCYATSSFEASRRNLDAHDPHSPSLIGHYDVPPPSAETQLSLF